MEDEDAITTLRRSITVATRQTGRATIPDTRACSRVCSSTRQS